MIEHHSVFINDEMRLDDVVDQTNLDHVQISTKEFSCWSFSPVLFLGIRSVKGIPPLTFVKRVWVHPTWMLSEGRKCWDQRLVISGLFTVTSINPIFISRL